MLTILGDLHAGRMQHAGFAHSLLFRVPEGGMNMDRNCVSLRERACLCGMSTSLPESIAHSRGKTLASKSEMQGCAPNMCPRWGSSSARYAQKIGRRKDQISLMISPPLMHTTGYSVASSRSTKIVGLRAS